MLDYVAFAVLLLAWGVIATGITWAFSVFTQRRKT